MKLGRYVAPDDPASRLRLGIAACLLLAGALFSSQAQAAPPAAVLAEGPRTPPDDAEPSRTPPAPRGVVPRAESVKEEVDYPRLVVAGHFAAGPHSPGEDSCTLIERQTVCDQTGSFFGLGGSAEVRGRLWRFIYAHGRIHAVGNISGRWKPSPIFDGLVMPGAGVGLYAPFAFVRVEGMVPITFGSGIYRAADTTDPATERWGYFAGSLTAGLRLRLAERWRGEVFGGFELGPRAYRDSPNTDFRAERLLFTFVLGLGVSFDVLE